MMTTNVIAPVALSAARCCPCCAAPAPSRIVNVGSMFGDIAYPLFATYSASKFALRGLSIAMRRELKPYGIGVTYAAPTSHEDRSDPGLRWSGRPRSDADRRSGHRRRAYLAGGLPRSRHAYAKGSERLFVLVQKFAPKFVDRAIATQMADPRIRDYLRKHPHPAAMEAAAATAGSSHRLRAGKRFSGTMREPAPGSTPTVGVTPGTVHRLQL